MDRILSVGARGVETTAVQESATGISAERKFAEIELNRNAEKLQQQKRELLSQAGISHGPGKA
jgi:hypothetical protein